ncbi:MAG: dienelactone hydrolase family protein [Gemmatimonadaceae bacterium]|nr:dienelactone hydrolase family protein [Gemmatimonadaceae bacterium]
MSIRPHHLLASALTVVLVGACMSGVQVPPVASPPAGSTDVAARLTASPRHGEWVMIRSGANDSVRAYVVHPERRERAPVVIVIHEIFGLTTWIRGVADQLAAEGYVAIAPDLLTGKAPLGTGDSLSNETARTVIQTLRADEVHRRLADVGQWGMRQPSASQTYAVLGFCWGGSTSFAHAVQSPAGLGAAVVYYGGSPPPTSLSGVRVPVLGLYAGDDARVNSTVPAADSTMRALGKTFEYRMFDNSGHGFLRQQDGRDGANLAAARESWPMAVAFLRKHLGA